MTALPAWRKGEARSGKFGLPSEERKAFAFEQRGGAGFAVAFYQLRFRVEKIELRGRADHVEVDDALGPRGEMRMARGKGIQAGRRSAERVAQQCG